MILIWAGTEKKHGQNKNKKATNKQHCGFQCTLSMFILKLLSQGFRYTTLLITFTFIDTNI